MKDGARMFWMGITAALTVVLLIFVFPILRDKYGTATAVLLGLVLIAGMMLYYLRGVLLTTSRLGGSQNFGGRRKRGKRPPSPES